MFANPLPDAPLMEAFKPSPALAEHVTDIWLWQIPAAAQQGQAAGLTLLPDGHPTFVFNFGGVLTANDGRRSFSTRSALCGFHGGPMRVSCDGNAAGITVRLRPWSLPRFVPMSAQQAAACRIDCRDLFRQAEIDDLESELFALPTSLARVRRVERFLIAHLREADDGLVREGVLRMTAAGGIGRVSLLAGSLGSSERTLERHFRRFVGVAPKALLRVIRLQSALTMPPTLAASWSERALEAGFFDQAHLIREMRELFGLVPTRLAEPNTNPLAQGFQTLARQTDLASSLFH